MLGFKLKPPAEEPVSTTLPNTCHAVVVEGQGSVSLPPHQTGSPLRLHLGIDASCRVSHGTNRTDATGGFIPVGDPALDNSHRT
ncbi:hypothetical protein [Streptomyces sp. NPDC059819]|uniref:hypothetical protein n=1 Tax=Streptomyces sp. NPDC059819 TaxID=3346963 RepID=UPI00365650F8